MLLFLFACIAPDGAALDTALSADTGDTDTTGDTGPAPAEIHGVPPESPVPAPTFTARNQNGEDRTQADLLGHPTVLWFYPAAGTYG